MNVKISDTSFNIQVTDSFGGRFKGLMGMRELPKGSGLLLEHCGAIHCGFMRFTIDAIYLDKDNKVVGKETVKPWGIGKIFKGAVKTLEVNEGEASNIKVGDEMIVDVE